MLNLGTLAELLRDEELRTKLNTLISAKVRADIKSLQVHAELSRRLIEATRGSGKDPAAVNRQRMLKTVTNEYLDYFGTIIEMSTGFNDRLLATLATFDKDRTSGVTRPPTLSMNLKGPLGTILRAPFEIENNRSNPVAAAFRLTPYVSEDGSQLVAANHAFDPPQAVVPPGGKVRVLFVQPIAEGFTVNRDYLATISVEGLDAMQIVVRLHVEQPTEMALPVAVAPATETVREPELPKEPEGFPEAPDVSKTVPEEAAPAAPYKSDKSSNIPKPARRAKRAPRNSS